MNKEYTNTVITFLNINYNQTYPTPKYTPIEIPNNNGIFIAGYAYGIILCEDSFTIIEQDDEHWYIPKSCSYSNSRWLEELGDLSRTANVYLKSHGEPLYIKKGNLNIICGYRLNK